MSSPGSLTAAWASRACHEHVPAALSALGYADAARELQDLPPFADVATCRQASEVARRHKQAFSLSGDERRHALREPFETAGASRAWVCLHLVDVIADAVGSYVFGEPALDDEDAAVVRAWVADGARTLAFLAGGQARADEEDARQQREEAALAPGR